MMHVTAGAVAAGEDHDADYFRLGLGDQGGGEGWRLIFHGGPADPAQRIDTERYAVETEDGFVSYGGVASLSATDDAVDLSFTDQAAADLRLPDAHLHIGLELTAAERELIEIGLSGSSPAPISPPGLTRSPCPMRGACHSARRRDAGASHANGSKCSRCSGSSTQMSWR
jgi:hypothetical protein